MTLSMQDRSPLAAADQDCRADAGLAAAPDSQRDLCLELPVLADPAALITELVRQAGSDGISIREIRARLETRLPRSELNSKQLFGFLNNPDNGFTGERLDERRADGVLVVYRLASPS